MCSQILLSNFLLETLKISFSFSCVGLFIKTEHSDAQCNEVKGEPVKKELSELTSIDSGHRLS